MSRLWSRKQNRSLLRLQSIRTALLPAKQTKGKSLFARDTLSDIFKCSSCDSEVLMCRCAVEWTIQAKRQGPRLPQPKAFLLILSYFVTCLHQNSLMILHQLGIQQAERETPAEAHISSVTNTSMRPCTLFYIETRQTLLSPKLALSCLATHRNIWITWCQVSETCQNSGIEAILV